MILRSLHLLSFRAHAEQTFTFAPKVNLIYGPNGVGKTNVLEAIHYLCLTKSFVTAQDQYVLRQGAPYFQVEGVFEGTRRAELKARIVYVPGEGKKVFINRAPLERLSEVVGLLPVVVLSPADHALTAAGPDERRRFLNNIISQARPVYLDDLLKYRRALRQRNELLQRFRRGRARPELEGVLGSWTEELVLLGSRVVAARLHFLEAFAAYLERAYQSLEAAAERPVIRYQGLAALPPGADEEAVAARYRSALEKARRREREQGRTLVGPHLDEMVFYLDEMEVRRYASQGQHRTFSLALKLAKYYFLSEQLDERPLFLLDDVFGSLDPHRAQTVLALLQRDEIGQSLLTATQHQPFSRSVDFEVAAHRRIHLSEEALAATSQEGL